MSVKVLLLGQAPSASSDPDHAFAGNSGRFLAALCGLTHAQFLALYARRNVCDEYHGKQERGNGDAVFNRQLPEDLPGPAECPLVIAVGAVASAAIGIKKKPLRYFEIHFINGRAVVPVPHPSGVNRWWNEPANKVRAGIFWCWLTRIARAFEERSLEDGRWKTVL